MDQASEPVPIADATTQRVTCHKCKRVVERSDAIDMRKLLDKPMTQPWRCRPCFRSPQEGGKRAA